MALSTSTMFLLCAIGIILLARPTHAFGAGNIGSTSKIEGQNWRHGDLEDTLLMLVASRAMGGKKFSKLDVKRVYFGNWLRDYSQAVDVGTVKYVSAEAIRILLWVLGFLSFGYGSGEFEVTTQRLGCYRPEEHIDNPKDYADNEDARQYDRRLRGPIDERRELSIDPQTGLKNYIANERAGIDTSAGLVRRLLGQSIELGRRYSRDKNKKDLYEALRLLGTASHCLEDYAAHSNYVELALIEMGERNVFPHVGRRTEIQLREVRHPVFPIVTGTFGGVDFLHSVCGEFDDKATQSEIEELEGTLTQYQNGRQDNSILQDLLNKIPDGVFGGKDEAGKANELKQNAATHQMQNTRISPRQPEEWANYLNDVQKQIYPIIEWHDEVMQSITETIEKIPILPDLIESLQEEINKFVFSLLAPYLLPIIKQIKNELNTGSNEIIQSSKDKQHIVFNDDNSSDPTHSMLSKDHFSNILNEPAGKVARQTVMWVVPQVVAAWDDESVDVDRTLNRILAGVLHHPALREFGQDGATDGRRLMFGVVEQWWQEKSEREKDGLRDQLSRRGVETGKNHKEGVNDHGHGSNKPLGMANLSSGGRPSGTQSSGFGAISSALGGGSNQGSRPSNQAADKIGQAAGAAVGGGVLGSLVGGIASAVGGDLLGGGLGEDKETYKRDTYGKDGSRTETVTQLGHSSSGDRYAQAQYTRTTGPGGERRQEEYNRFEQTSSGGHLQSEIHHQERTSGGQYREETRRYGDDNDRSSYGRQQESGSGSYGRNHRDDNQSSVGYGGDRQRYESQSSGYGGSQTHGGRGEDSSGGSYGRQQESSYGRQQESSYGRQQESSYGRQQESSYSASGGGGGYGRQQESSYGRQDESGYSGRQQESSYGRQEQSSYGRQQESSYSSGGGSGYGRQEDSSYGGRQQESTYGSGGYGAQQGYSSQSGRKKDDSDDDKKKYKKKYGKKDDDSEDENQGYGRHSKKESDDDNDDNRYKQHRKKKSDDEDSDDDKKKKKYGRGGESGGYGGGGGSYGGGQSGGYGGGQGGGYGGERRDEYSRY